MSIAATPRAHGAAPSRSNAGVRITPRFPRLPCLLAVAWALLVCPAAAQWQTQNIPLQPGWNGVFLHVDASHATLTSLLASAPLIEEVWLWRPEVNSAQFVESPDVPTDTGTRWISWRRSQLTGSKLGRLIGNAAYLVKLSGTATHTWTVQGKPVPPVYQWTSSGLNFFGFPTVPASPPRFDAFLSQAPELGQGTEIFRYVGGEMGTGNPARVFDLRGTTVRRGEAFWIRSDGFNRFFGPFELVFQDNAGAHFGVSLAKYEILLRNNAAVAVTVTLDHVASETPPAGQPVIVGRPELLVRGELNTTTLTYGFTNLNAGPQSWTLAAAGKPGSTVSLVLGVDRRAMTGAPGGLYAGVLRFTDSRGFTSVEVPVTATQGSPAGLWVGEVIVSQVRTGLPGGGFGPVQRPARLRLILHHDAAGNTRLLQRVYYGFNSAQEPVLATTQAALNQQMLAASRRISAVHLPWSTNSGAWTCTGAFAPGQTIQTTVTEGCNHHASNPFLHTYHPDHDNRNATFDAFLPRGRESFDIVRDISLALRLPSDGFDALTRAGRQLVGDYAETLKLLGGGGDAKEYAVTGGFTLNRLTDLGALITTAP